MNQPKFSVIIPTYNRADRLSLCLQKLEEQTVSDFEVLVCDDGSNDHTAEVVDRYKKRLHIQYHYCENFGGPAKPRNIGLKHALSDWVCFLDADDYWYPAKLEKTWEHTEHSDVIYHGFDIVDMEGGKIGRHKVRTMQPPYFEYLMLYDNPIVNSSVCIKKELLQSIGGFSEDKELIAVEDFELWLRLAYKKKEAVFSAIHAPLGAYLQADDNISKANHTMLKRQQKLHALYINKLSGGNKRKAVATFNYKIGRIYQNMQAFKQARSCFLKSIRSPNKDYQRKSLLLFIYCSIKIFK